MDSKSRIRINLKTREIELEGPETFIDKYNDIIKGFIEKISDPEESIGPLTEASKSDSTEINTNHSTHSISALPESFGEYYTRFPRNLKVVDKILIASYYSQLKSEDGLFSIKESADLLTEQNVQITNANAFIKALVNTGKLFKHAGKYKVSERGVEQIAQMQGT